MKNQMPFIFHLMDLMRSISALSISRMFDLKIQYFRIARCFFPSSSSYLFIILMSIHWFLCAADTNR